MAATTISRRATETPTRPAAARTTRDILAELFGPPARRTFAVRLWDGTIDEPGMGRATAFTLVLRRPGALRRMFLPPSELALGEAYLRDDFDIEGDMEAAAGLTDALAGHLRAPLALARLAARLRTLPANDLPTTGDARGVAARGLTGRQHTRRRDAAAVRFHYDAGNDFYALWLDRRMVYSCGYFATGAEDLAAAQEAKLEHICRKLRLRPGERLLDIGCGWGGLVQYAVERHGVKALGITLSEEQATLARQRIAAVGLGDRCRVEVRDYRDLPAGMPFDKVVSVGMFEHVGRASLPAYFAAAYRLTRPGGLFLNHGIVDLNTTPPGLIQRAACAVWQPASFIRRYVFPDGELVVPAEALRHAEVVGFETRDVESLREHYALTLRAWVRQLEGHRDAAVRAVGDEAYRVWRLYMAACARGFATGRIGVIQALFSKPDAAGRTHLPPTRADLYQVAGAVGVLPGLPLG